MSSWTDRPVEEAALLNPAYLALILNGVAGGYAEDGPGPLPFVLAFVGIPLVASSANRTALPKTVATSFAHWLERNAEVRERAPHQMKAFAPLVREAIIYGVASNAITLSLAGEIAPILTPRLPKTSHLTDILKRARLVGRLLARTGTPATAMRLVGVTP